MALCLPFWPSLPCLRLPLPRLRLSPTVPPRTSPVHVDSRSFDASPSPSFEALPPHTLPPPSWPTRCPPSPKKSKSKPRGLAVSTSRPSSRSDPPKKRTLRSTRSITTAAAQRLDEDVDVEDFTAQIALEGDSDVESEVEAPKRRKRVAFKESSPALGKTSGDQEATRGILLFQCYNPLADGLLTLACEKPVFLSQSFRPRHPC